MKNKARNRKANGQHQNGIHKNKELIDQSENETENKVGLELMIFRTLFSLILIVLTVYGLYMLLGSTVLTNNINNIDNVDKKETSESFVELDSDVEDSEEKEITVEEKPDKSDSSVKEAGEPKKGSEALRTKSSMEKKDETQHASKMAEQTAKTDSAPRKPNSNEKTKKKQPSSKMSNDIKKVRKDVDDFKVSHLKTMAPKKIFVDGRRLPPVELLPQKPNNSSVRVFLYDEFLSEQECDGLMKAHDGHVKESSKISPLLCFDTIETLRKHLKAAHKKVKVTPADFIPGTFCVNETFSKQLSTWLKSNWSYSTAFYPGESRFSKIFEHRVKEATKLLPENGGKFQITSYPEGIGYKTHTDCMEDSDEKRDRFATILVYLQDVEDGGETKFPELGIWVKPRKGRALVWNNMNEDGKCEALSIHNAAKVNKGHKYIIQRWYYYENFYSLGKRPPEPELPLRAPGTPRVNCDEFEKGSCRWYDEWNYEHLVDYRNQRINLK